MQEIPISKKKQIEVKKATEIEEKVKKGKVKVDKTKIEKKHVSITIDEIKPVNIEETDVVEYTEDIITETKDKKSIAKSTIPVQEPLSTEAIASCKKIDEVQEIIETLEQKAEKIIPLQEPLTIIDTRADDLIQEFKDKLPEMDRASTETKSTVMEQATVTEIKLEDIIQRVESIIVQEEIKMAKEVTEVLDLIKANEFGPGKYPLRELAEIGYLMKTGVTVNEITILYNENKFPSLKTPHAQSALVNVVERKGYSPLISQVLTEETTSDEGRLAATVGFKAFMKMIELKHATVEEVITQFSPDDFVQRVWEVTEVKEVSNCFYDYRSYFIYKFP